MFLVLLSVKPQVCDTQELLEHTYSVEVSHEKLSHAAD